MDAFDIWTNAGSHTIMDDFDQTIDVGATQRFLQLFRDYFDLQDHGAYFDMMVTTSNGHDLLEEGQIFFRTTAPFYAGQ